MVAHIDEATHLVSNSFARTIKFLVAINRALPIVSTQWLHASKAANSFVGSHFGHLGLSQRRLFADPTQFSLVDVKAEVEFHFKLKDALTKAATGEPIFMNLSFYVRLSLLCISACSSHVR